MCNDIRGMGGGSDGTRNRFFVSAGVQTAVIGTYAQQVVTRVVGCSWRLCPACAPARIAEPARLFHYAFGLLGKLLAGFLARRFAAVVRAYSAGVRLAIAAAGK